MNFELVKLVKKMDERDRHDETFLNFLDLVWKGESSQVKFNPLERDFSLSGFRSEQSPGERLLSLRV